MIHSAGTLQGFTQASVVVVEPVPTNTKALKLVTIGMSNTT